MDKRLKRIIHRYALWKAHDRICIYCGTVIPTVFDLEEDHIIPQIHKEKPEELEKIIEEYGLREDFDIDAYYNRVPTTSGCNRKKAFSLYNKEAIHTYINLAEKKASKVKKIEEKTEKKISATDDLFKKGMDTKAIEKLFKLMSVEDEGKRQNGEVFNAKIVKEQVISLRKHYSFIKDNGMFTFEFRLWKIRLESLKISENSTFSDTDLEILKNLIDLMRDFVKEAGIDFVKWGTDLLYLSSRSPSLCRIIKNKCYNHLKTFYPPKEYNPDLIDLLDKLGHFPDDTIPEMIQLFKNRENLPIRQFLNNLHRRKLTLSKEKKEEYIDEISKSLVGLPDDPNDKEIRRLAHSVRSLLSK